MTGFELVTDRQSTVYKSDISTTVLHHSDKLYKMTLHGLFLYTFYLRIITIINIFQPNTIQPTIVASTLVGNYVQPDSACHRKTMHLYNGSNTVLLTKFQNMHPTSCRNH